SAGSGNFRARAEVGRRQLGDALLWRALPRGGFPDGTILLAELGLTHPDNPIMAKPPNDPPASPATLLRSIPQVDRLLQSEEFQPLLAAHSREEVLREVRGVLDGLRRDAARLEPEALTFAAIRDR